MSLGLWGKFLIVMAGCSAFLVAVVVVSCFVGPGCWGFEYLRRKDEKKKKEKLVQNNRTGSNGSTNCVLGHYYWVDANDYVVYQTGPEEKIHKVDDPPVYHSRDRIFNLKCAPLLVAPTLYSTLKDSAPKLEIKLSYTDLNTEDMCRLAITIVSASSLRCREYVATLDPFVVLEILNNKWSLQKNERIVHTVQTQVVKNNTNPVFDQNFVFDVKKIEMKNWCLKFTVTDNDRLIKLTPLFEKRVYLKDLKTLNLNGHLSLALDMQDVTSSVGALLLGVSYLPTAQRLNISVIKTNRIKYHKFTPNVAEFHPYVRVIMVNNHGKFVKKKKTYCRHGDDSPVFNQSLVFDLSISNLEQTVFLVLLCNKTYINKTISDDSSVDGDIEVSLKQSKDKVLGSIVIGRNVKGTRARDHWVTVLQNPRKMISVWHDLR